MTGGAVLAELYAASAGFDLGVYLAGIDRRLLATAEGRRVLTRTDPLAFALTYLPHHLRGEETGGEITLADFHVELCRYARTWVRPNDVPMRDRDVWVAPRHAGKSTWLFLVLPLWAAAHGHSRFVAAFSDSAPQAEQHLATFRGELENNTLLRQDYPDLCTPARRPRGVTVADNRHLIHERNGFVFAARGIDAGVLGIKVGNRRPDLIVCDDIEPHEGIYSAYQANKRLGTLTDAILPLNVFARVVVVGTTVMAGSIVHQLVRTALEPEEDHPPWIKDENFRVHYFPPIVTGPYGERRSCWPDKWPLEFLEGIEHTRSYAKNYKNAPVNINGDYWGEGDFTYADLPCARTILSIDPATTDKQTSHPYGLAVVGKVAGIRRCVVKHAHSARMSPAGLRTWALGTLGRFPEVGGVLIETNQGGDTWFSVLHDLPVRVATIHQSEPKPARATRLLNHYQRKLADGLPEFVHAHRLPALEAEMTSYPKGLANDMVDAVGSAGFVFLDRGAQPAPSGHSTVYA